MFKWLTSKREPLPADNRNSRIQAADRRGRNPGDSMTASNTDATLSDSVYGASTFARPPAAPADSTFGPDSTFGATSELAQRETLYTVPLLGQRRMETHQRVLTAGLAVSLLLALAIVLYAVATGAAAVPAQASAGEGWLVRLDSWLVGLPLALLVLAMLFAGAMAQLQVQVTRQRQEQAERLRAEARAKEKEAKRINDANQAAILRLMNELQLVAEGDLTQQATVTEDITGAIADSVNYTVEELRSLVGHVQSTATRVTRTTAEVENTSIELLAASTEQLREIRDSGQAVLDMAQRILQTSRQAQTSAAVAREALEAAESGAKAVQDTIGGMNTIREQIQDTAKRIKRLGESSQEIGEITQLISDITEQTNVLALNAAIQAASAGEAGRGFAVVAEEVQRLAERSGDATRQIAALVRAIQTDTQDTVQAMERSTREVVAGTHLSDKAGAALADIDRLSRRVAELVEQIAATTSQEAELAGQTATSIQHIFAVTEQTGEGTRSTVKQVHDLARIADELRESVARFKIA